MPFSRGRQRKVGDAEMKAAPLRYISLYSQYIIICAYRFVNAFSGKTRRRREFSIDKTAFLAVYWWVIMEQYLLCQRSDENEGYP